MTFGPGRLGNKMFHPVDPGFYFDLCLDLTGRLRISILENTERTNKMYTSTIILLIAAAVVAGLVFSELLFGGKHETSAQIKDCIDFCLSGGQYSADRCSGMCSTGPL
jgi:hypothetical protein